jgi:hypothetical protein
VRWVPAAEVEVGDLARLKYGSPYRVLAVMHERAQGSNVSITRFQIADGDPVGFFCARLSHELVAVEDMS